MSSAVNIRVYYGNGMLLTLEGKPFYQSMLIAWGGVLSDTQHPLKIEFLSTNKILYADRNQFMAYLSNKITLQDLIQATECDNVYRNTQEIICLGQPLEAGQLWKKIQNRIFLIDDDSSIDIPFEEGYFIRVE